jgi:hypothetical protein
VDARSKIARPARTQSSIRIDQRKSRSPPNNGIPDQAAFTPSCFHFELTDKRGGRKFGTAAQAETFALSLCDFQEVLHKINGLIGAHGIR